jgi:hypothetical protein
MNTPQSASQATPPKKRRWWLYLLIGFTGLVLLVLMAGLLIFVKAKAVLRDYTSTAPKPLPIVQFDPVRQKELENRWTEFSKAVQSRQNPPPFELSADDMNLLLAKDKEARGHVYFVITNSQLLVEFSAPLEQKGRKDQPDFLRDALRGRYLNGVARINLVFEEGLLSASLGGLEANGRKAPGLIMKHLQRQDLLKQMDLDHNHDVLGLFQELRSIKVKDDRIVLAPREPGK